MFTFVGGPLDGRKFDHLQLNAVGETIPVFTESGNRSFQLMPPAEQCERILRGEIDLSAVAGPLTVYERVFTHGGSVEFHVSSMEALEEARSPQVLTPEAQARKRVFGEQADRFIEEIRGAAIDPGTEVYIVYECVDQEGNPAPESRLEMAAVTTVTAPGSEEWAREFAATVHRDTIIGNINSAVRHAPTGFTTFREHPATAVRILGFRLEIVPGPATD
jgi:hypothetical protein